MRVVDDVPMPYGTLAAEIRRYCRWFDPATEDVVPQCIQVAIREGYAAWAPDAPGHLIRGDGKSRR